jgi:hypothetical protein
MPILFRVDHPARTVVATATGAIGFDDVDRHLTEEVGSGGLGYHELLDARQATANLTADEIRRLVKRARSLAAEQRLGPTALVVDNDVSYGMGRMYAILSEDFDPEFGVFRDLGQAAAWLAGRP